MKPWRKKSFDPLTHTYTLTHRAVEHHAVAVAHALDVRGEVEADRSVADGVHGLGVEEVMRPRWEEENKQRAEGRLQTHNAHRTPGPWCQLTNYHFSSFVDFFYMV